MGWTIEPTDNVTTSTTEDGKFKVEFGSRTGKATETYKIKYDDGSSCGEFTVVQTGDTEPTPVGSYPFKVKIVNGTSDTVVIGGGSNNGIKIYVCGKPVRDGSGCHVSVEGISSGNITLAPGGDYTYDLDGSSALECLARSTPGGGCGGAPGATKLYFQDYNENADGSFRAVKIYNSEHSSNMLIADPIGCGGTRQEIVMNQTYTVTIKSSDGSGQATCL
jgi:hypothetical protein